MKLFIWVYIVQCRCAIVNSCIIVLFVLLSNSEPFDRAFAPTVQQDKMVSWCSVGSSTTEAVVPDPFPPGLHRHYTDAHHPTTVSSG